MPRQAGETQLKLFGSAKQNGSPTKESEMPMFKTRRKSGEKMKANPITGDGVKSESLQMQRRRSAEEAKSGSNPVTGDGVQAADDKMFKQKKRAHLGVSKGNPLAGDGSEDVTKLFSSKVRVSAEEPDRNPITGNKMKEIAAPKGRKKNENNKMGDPIKGYEQKRVPFRAKPEDVKVSQYDPITGNPIKGMEEEVAKEEARKARMKTNRSLSNPITGDGASTMSLMKGRKHGASRQLSNPVTGDGKEDEVKLFETRRHQENGERKNPLVGDGGQEVTKLFSSKTKLESREKKKDPISGEGLWDKDQSEKMFSARKKQDRRHGDPIQGYGDSNATVLKGKTKTFQAISLADPITGLPNDKIGPIKIHKTNEKEKRTHVFAQFNISDEDLMVNGTNGETHLMNGTGPDKEEKQFFEKLETDRESRLLIDNYMNSW